MRERLTEVLGGAGVAVLLGALIVTAPRFLVFLWETESVSQDLSPLVWASVLLALVMLIFTGTRSASDPGTNRLGTGDVLVRVAAVLGGLALAWFTFPARHLGVTVVNDRYRLFPEQVTELWIGVCAIALGLALLLFSPRSLSWRLRGRPLMGVVAGATALALIVGLTPTIRYTLMVEHTVADAAGEPAPVPATVTRVGWSWQPEHPVMGVERGPLGPIVRYADGFVALDGATGEELWTYRRPHARQVRTGLFVGSSEYAYLLHVAEPGPEPETQSMVVLNTANGRIVREALLPPLGDEDQPQRRYLTPEVRVSVLNEDGEQLVVAHSTRSTERLWEFPLADTPQGRVCLWARNDGIRGYADRVLIARLCLDEPDVPGSSVEDTLTAIENVPDDAVESVIALDSGTGQQVWRRDWAPEDLRLGDPPVVSAPAAGSAGAAVVITSGGTFAVADGEPVTSGPDAAAEADDHVLDLDTAHAVVVREYGDDDPATLLRTDAEGVVLGRTRVDRDMRFWWDLAHAAVLDGAVVTPYTSHNADGRASRELALVSLDGEQGRWEGIDLGGELLPELTEAWQTPVEHRVLAVPGAVVSYIDDSNEPGFDPEPLHGLVA
ncbi:hypothetical protein AB0I72_03905 [Nocardiopsis sp. NPDC049922]|uniref:hypothetical protein n=1 Tax=Nocardiopsis sp. NPDC049922 TaxID=3155157 RepID=UPI0033F4A8F9